MNGLYKVIGFSILLNFAVGLMLIALPVFDVSSTGGLQYDATYEEDFNDEMSSAIRPSGELEDQGDSIYRVLDTLNLGFIAKFLKMVDTYMFGFLNMLYAVFGPALGDIGIPVFSILKTILVVLYVFAALQLWTGKDLNE